MEELSSLDRFRLKRACSRWQGCYWVAYLNAAFNIASGFILKDDLGNTVLGFSLIYTGSVVGFGILIALLGWGIHKKRSFVCLLILLVLVVVDMIVAGYLLGDIHELVASGATAVFLIRGIFGLRELKVAAYRHKGSSTVLTDKISVVGSSIS